MAMPLAVLEITDTQVCTVLATHAETLHIHYHTRRRARCRSRVRAAPTLRLAQVTLQESTPLSSIQKAAHLTLEVWVQGRSRSVPPPSPSRIALRTTTVPPWGWSQAQSPRKPSALPSLTQTRTQPSTLNSPRGSGINPSSIGAQPALFAASRPSVTICLCSSMRPPVPSPTYAPRLSARVAVRSSGTRWRRAWRASPCEGWCRTRMVALRRRSRTRSRRFRPS